jgi:hypothetical protein
MPYWRLHHPFVWATRDRIPLIGTVEEAVIRRSVDLTVADLDLIPHAFGFTPDHDHVAVSIPPKGSVSSLGGTSVTQPGFQSRAAAGNGVAREKTPTSVQT